MSTKSRGRPAGQGPCPQNPAGRRRASRKSRGGAGPCPQNPAGGRRARAPCPENPAAGRALVHKIAGGQGRLSTKSRGGVSGQGPLSTKSRGILWTRARHAAGFCGQKPLALLGQQGPFHWKNSNFLRRLILLNLRLTERCEIEFCRLSRQIRKLNSSEKSRRTALFRAKQGGPLRFF